MPGRNESWGRNSVSKTSGTTRTKKSPAKNRTSGKSSAKSGTVRTGESQEVLSSLPPDVVTIDRRSGKDRRSGEDRRKQQIPVAVERRKGERRKVQRRRLIDPTTCERDYTPEEIEFMLALDQYKRASGRMFPTCSEILEVLRGLGYRKCTCGGTQAENTVGGGSSEPVTPSHTSCGSGGSSGPAGNPEEKSSA